MEDRLVVDKVGERGDGEGCSTSLGLAGAKFISGFFIHEWINQKVLCIVPGIIIMKNNTKSKYLYQ